MTPPDAPIAVVPIETARKEPQAREKQLEQAWCEAENDLYAGLHAAGLLDAAHISPGSDPNHQTPVERLLVRLWTAHCHLTRYHEGRIHRLEQTLRHTLARPAHTDASRTGVLQALYGPAGRRRDVNILTDVERRLFDNYRRINVAGKQMIRTLFAQLAGDASKKGAQPTGGR
jgi:hypothetical protein